MNESKKNSVLVIDDENSNIMTLTEILSSDYIVYAAKNWHSALAAAEKYTPDVILLDIIMPDMDGYAIIAALKDSEKTQSIPVIFITGLNSAGDEEKGLSLGAVDYIIKPFSPALVKLRVLNQIKLIEQFRMNEYEIMKYKLANDALNIALWDMDIVVTNPINPGNKFTYSQEFRQMLGFSDENDFPNVLHSWSGRLHPDDKKKALDAFAAHINDRTGLTPFDMEYRLMLINGDYRTFRAFGTTLRDNFGIPIRAAGAVMDITERQKLEEARMTSRAKSAFLANMSHEIRTPMNAILGITEILMQDEALPDKLMNELGKIRNSCDMLLGIINDILDLSKIEAGKLDILPAKYNVASLINDSINLNMTKIGEKPIKFEVEINENTPTKLIGDELRIKQVLNNLLSNAFKYTDSGKVILSVSCDPLYSEYGLSKFISLILNVRDTGHGMTGEQIKKLFDEYSRFNQESGRTIEGTGLGLAITKRLIDYMEGSINVESEPGKGSFFTVRLPQSTVDAEVLGRELVENLQNFHFNYKANQSRSRIIHEPMPYGSVLVVDDVEMNLYVAKGLLKPYKLKIDTALSGFESVNKVKNGKVYDIIFMDQMMPEMDGMKTTGILRDLGYTNPIVALTANALAGQVDIFLQNGFDAFVSKPIDIRHLDSVLNKFIRDKQPLEVIEATRLQFGASEANDKEAVNHTYDDFFKAIGNINEINIKIGLKSLSNDKNIYRNTLGIFYKNLKQQFDDITTFLKAGDLVNFSIIVHAMKSQLATIGAVDLSDIAFNLETAAKAGDTFTCEALFPCFYDSVLALYEKLMGAFPSEVSVDKKSGDAATLQEAVEKALYAAAEYDSDAGIAAIESLLTLDFGEDINALLKTSADKFKEFDCEKAVEVLGEIISDK